MSENYYRKNKGKPRFEFITYESIASIILNSCGHIDYLTQEEFNMLEAWKALDFASTFMI